MSNNEEKVVSMVWKDLPPFEFIANQEDIGARDQMLQRRREMFACVPPSSPEDEDKTLRRQLCEAEEEIRRLNFELDHAKEVTRRTKEELNELYIAIDDFETTIYGYSTLLKPLKRE